MKIQNYAQATFETCLAVDLLQLTEEKISKDAELRTISYAMNFSKDNFTIGHLDFIAKNYDLELDFYVDNCRFLNLINKFKFSNKINVIHKKIGLNLINNLIKISPVILYVDSFALWKITHAPHFIIVIQWTKDGYKIYDPWDGRIRTISSDTLSKGIINLRNLLKYCPQLIRRSNNLLREFLLSSHNAIPIKEAIRRAKAKYS
ncbi:hypothetical protein J4206_02435 [Candidatus Woesearchaeota archaeon]|nr:hypothetical protein [Candidatus Woesearchaeota archaeon]